MSFKSKVFAAAATLTLVGGIGVAGAVTAGAANAATPSCGRSCIDIFSYEFGTHRSPNFALDVFRQAARVGQPIILFRTSNTDPAEDFTVSLEGTVNQFYALGLVSAALDLHYGNFEAYQIEYAPYGVNSGLCVGVGMTPTDLTPVSLQPCGASAGSVWVADAYDTIRGGYVPLINGADTNFSNPYVLHYPGNGYPTDIPRPQLNTYTLQKYSNGVVFDNEMWGYNFGVLR
jgi:hypothetical protein